MSLDGDSKVKSLSIADDLSKAGCDVNVCFLTGEKDFGDMTKDEVNKILRTSSRHDAYNTLRHKIGIMRSGSIF